MHTKNKITSEAGTLMPCHKIVIDKENFEWEVTGPVKKTKTGRQYYPCKYGIFNGAFYLPKTTN